MKKKKNNNFQFNCYKTFLCEILPKRMSYLFCLRIGVYFQKSILIIIYDRSA